MTGQTEGGYVLTFTLLGENPNKTPLPLRSVNYSLALENDRVFEGTRSAQATIPAKGSQEITLPVAVENDAAGLAPEGSTLGPAAGATAGYRIAGSIEYVLPGSISELLFDYRVRRPKAGFAENGTFEFTEAPMQDPSKVGPPGPPGPGGETAPGE